MTPEAQLALVNSIPTIIASLTALIGALVALKATTSKQDTENTNREVSGKLDHITTLTNSTLTAANDRIEKLENIIAEMAGEKIK